MMLTICLAWQKQRVCEKEFSSKMVDCGDCAPFWTRKHVGMYGLDLLYSARVPHHKSRVFFESLLTVGGSHAINLGSSSGPQLQCAGPTP